MSSLLTTDAVIDALGGNADVAKLCKVSPRAVSNWREWGRNSFPTETYLIINHALTSRGLSAPVSLWKGMRVSEEVCA